MNVAYQTIVDGLDDDGVAKFRAELLAAPGEAPRPRMPSRIDPGLMDLMRPGGAPGVAYGGRTVKDVSAREQLTPRQRMARAIEGPSVEAFPGGGD